MGGTQRGVLGENLAMIDFQPLSDMCPNHRFTPRDRHHVILRPKLPGKPWMRVSWETFFQEFYGMEKIVKKALF